jgi:TBC1 domain family member 6
VIESLCKEREPLVNEKILEVGLSWAVILPKWLICLFVDVLPIETVLRILDVAFSEGYKIIFRIILAIIAILKDDIMGSNDINELADVFRKISTDPRMLDAHSFLQSVFKVKLRRSEIEVLRAQFKAR